MIKIIGLMLTRDDIIVLEDWLKKYRDWFDVIFCLDGSIKHRSQSKKILLKYDVKYSHDDDYNFLKKTDQILRKSVYSKIQKYIQDKSDKNIQYWIVCAHPDEFYITNFKYIISTAIKNDAEFVIYRALHNMPHVNDMEKYLKSYSYKDLKYFLYNGAETHKEHRIYKYTPSLYYGDRHSMVVPYKIKKKNSDKFYPCYYHYKLQSLNPNDYDERGTIKNSTWAGIRSHYPAGHKFDKIENFFLKKPAGKYTDYKVYEIYNLPKDVY